MKLGHVVDTVADVARVAVVPDYRCFGAAWNEPAVQAKSIRRVEEDILELKATVSRGLYQVSFRKENKVLVDQTRYP